MGVDGRGPDAVVLEITRQQGTSGGGGKQELSPNDSVFAPNGQRRDAGDESRSFSDPTSDAPEKKLTLFALRLAVLEKAASSLGTLAFIWATVVLLGGFAIALDTVDFWVITTILVIEGARIFSRVHELEWQHQATRSAAQRIFKTLSTLRRRRSSDRGSKRTSTSSTPTGEMQRPRTRAHSEGSHARRAWESSEVPLVPYVGGLLDTGGVSRLLYWLQLLSASTCVALSLERLSKQSFGEIQKGDTDKRNRKAALNIFYSLALAEALLFLAEKLYCEFQIKVRKLLVGVSKECGLGESPADLVPIRRFFYDAFSRCIEGSIFDGAKMELVSFAEDLLGSDSRDEQLIGARILRQLVTSVEFGRDTLRKIGTSAATMERLVDMLNWKSTSETDLRRYAAEVVEKLASKKQNMLRVAGIPGAMESIASLLQNPKSSTKTVPRPHELHNSCGNEGRDNDEDHYDYRSFNLLGLGILKKMAHNHDNCGKIGNTRDLLPIIIQFTASDEWLLVPKSQRHNAVELKARVKKAQRSLKLLQMLVNSSGMTGVMLRRGVADIVFTVGYMRDIVRDGGEHRQLQKLAIEIMTCLALDADTRDRIGGTGGVIKHLSEVFFAVTGGGADEQQYGVAREAGEALALLALESPENCNRILRIRKVVYNLTVALGDAVLRVNAARILTYLCAYSNSGGLRLLREVTDAAPSVLRSLMEVNEKEKKPLEVSAGLALQIFRLMSREETEGAFRVARIKDTELAERLIRILRSYSQPSIKEPRIRRYIVELMIWMMKPTGGEPAAHIIDAFNAGGVKEQLEIVAETTSELELYNVFSGSTGLSRHHTTIECLVETAMHLVDSGIE